MQGMEIMTVGSRTLEPICVKKKNSKSSKIFNQTSQPKFVHFEWNRKKTYPKKYGDVYIKH